MTTYLATYLRAAALEIAATLEGGGSLAAPVRRAEADIAGANGVRGLAHADLKRINPDQRLDATLHHLRTAAGHIAAVIKDLEAERETKP